MITRENLNSIINLITNKDKKRILNSSKEYTVLYLYVFNVGSYVTVRLTNDYNRYKNVYYNGNAILYTDEVKDLIEDI